MREVADLHNLTDVSMALCYKYKFDNLYAG
jgi:hypothetical protein